MNLLRRFVDVFRMNSIDMDALTGKNVPGRGVRPSYHCIHRLGKYQLSSVKTMFGNAAPEVRRLRVCQKSCETSLLRAVMQGQVKPCPLPYPTGSFRKQGMLPAM